MNARTREEWEQMSVQKAAENLVHDLMHEESRELRRSIPRASEVMEGADLTGYVNYDFPSKTLLMTIPAKMLMLHRISRSLERIMIGGNLDDDQCENLMVFMVKSFEPMELTVWMKDVSIRSGISFSTFPKTPSMRKLFATAGPYVRGLITDDFIL